MIIFFPFNTIDIDPTIQSYNTVLQYSPTIDFKFWHSISILQINILTKWSIVFSLNLSWSNGLVVKAPDSQSTSSEFKTTEWR